MGQAATGGACSRGRVERATTRSTHNTKPTRHGERHARTATVQPQKVYQDRCHDRCPCSALVLVAVGDCRYLVWSDNQRTIFNAEKGHAWAQSKLVGCTTLDTACRRTTRKPSSGTPKPPSKGRLGAEQFGRHLPQRPSGSTRRRGGLQVVLPFRCSGQHQRDKQSE